MSLKQSLHFEPGVTPLALVIAAVHAAYGAAPAATATAQLPIGDNPATGTEDNDAGAGGTFDPLTPDANGLPWDERIHSGAKTRTSKNIWTKRKGVADTVVAQVTAELRARGGVASGANIAGSPAGGGIQVQQPAALTIGGGGLQPLGQPTPSPFESLMHFIAEQQSKRPDFTATYVTDSLKAWGIVDAQGNGSTAAMQNLPAETIAQIRAAFCQVLGLPAGS